MRLAMENDLRRMMQAFFDVTAKPYEQACWRPAVDVYRGRNGWLVKLDLAGVRPEDIELRIAGRRLIVQGVRRDLSVLEEQLAYSMEISYNRFQRSVELPIDIGQAEVRSEYRDGMLLVLITP
jgi:HSP20 family protein